MQHTLVAVFDNRTDAESAKNELLSSGFSAQEVRLSEGDQGSATTGAAGATTTGSSSTTAASGDHGMISGIKHFFSDLFGSDDSEHAQKYSTAVSRGHHVLTLVANSEPEVERAADIVEKYGPVDIDEQSAKWSGGTLAGDAARMGSGAQQQSALLSQQSTQGAQQGSATQGSQQRAGTESAAIPIIQEELQVGKREVQRGGVRVFQHVVETPVNETVSLREEHVSVERHPVDQPVSPADLAALQEKTIELRETAEEVVVQKSARVVEEVVVGKEVGQREETVSDTLRHTEVEVEQLGAAGSRAGTGTDDAYFRTHYNSNYANAGGRYEDYAPAYSYGSTMASSDQYRGRKWDEVEPSLRSDWEARNAGGGSTWEKIKAAVRHGWEKIT